jgi:hypothetical protein
MESIKQYINKEIDYHKTNMNLLKMTLGEQANKGYFEHILIDKCPMTELHKWSILICDMEKLIDFIDTKLTEKNKEYIELTKKFILKFIEKYKFNIKRIEGKVSALGFRGSLESSEYDFHRTNKKELEEILEFIELALEGKGAEYL